MNKLFLKPILSFSFLTVFSIVLSTFLFAAEPKSEDLLNPLKKIQAALAQKAKKETKIQKVVKKLMPEKAQVEGLKLEGVARGTHGGSDIAMINSDAYRAGEEINGYRILEIHPNYIQIEHQTTHEKHQIWVSGTPSSQEMREMGLTPEWKNEKTAHPGLWLRISGWLAQLGWMSKPDTDSVLMDLRRMDYAAELMKNQKAQFPQKISELIENQYLPDDFLKNQLIYEFSLDEKGVRADPKTKYPELPHFFIDQNDLIRAEKKNPATAASPLWDKAAS